MEPKMLQIIIIEKRDQFVKFSILEELVILIFGHIPLF